MLSCTALPSSFSETLSASLRGVKPFGAPAPARRVRACSQRGVSTTTFFSHCSIRPPSLLKYSTCTSTRTVFEWCTHTWSHKGCFTRRARRGALGDAMSLSSEEVELRQELYAGAIPVQARRAPPQLGTQQIGTPSLPHRTRRPAVRLLSRNRV